jgi:hypothetical protein
VLDEAGRENALSEQEQQLLDLIRAGKVDAEIAVRLGVSNAEVKERIERLMWRRGARYRDDLRRSEAGPAPGPVASTGGSRSPKSLAAIATTVIALLAVGFACGWLLRGGGDVAPADAAASSAPTLPPTLPPPTQTPYATTIAGRQMQLLGQPFSARQPLKMAIDTRETSLVLRFAEPVVFRWTGLLDDARWAGGGSNGFVLAIEQAQRTISLFVVLEPDSQVVYGDNDSVALVTSGAPGPTMLVYARTPEGPAYYHLEMDSVGRLYVSSQQVPANLPVAFDTGQVLDTSQMLPVGSTTPNDHWILCGAGEGSPCTSLLRGDLVPLAAGSLACDQESGVLTFVSAGESGASLTMKWEQPSSPLACRDAAREVAAGEALGYGGVFTVSARARNGSPLSVLITRHGVVYVSPEMPSVGCPCRTGT